MHLYLLPGHFHGNRGQGGGGDKHFSFIINFSKNIQILFILYILHLKTKTTNQHAEHGEHLGHMILSHLDCDIIYTDLRAVSEWTGNVTLVL